MTSLPQEEKEEATKLKKEMREKVWVPTCLAAVIATTELNRKRTRTRTKGDERCEKEENKQEKSQLRPSCEVNPF